MDISRFLEIQKINYDRNLSSHDSNWNVNGSKSLGDVAIPQIPLLSPNKRLSYE